MVCGCAVDCGAVSRLLGDYRLSGLDNGGLGMVVFLEFCLGLVIAGLILAVVMQ